MELKEFVKEIARGIEERLEGVKVIPTETMRNNGVIQNGITLRMNDEKISPVLYLNFWFRRFKKGELTMPDILEKIIKEYKELPNHIPDIDEWLSDVDLMDKIKIRLVNKKANERMIATRKLVNYDLAFTDLVALFYLNVMSGKESIGATGITEYMLDKYLPTITNEKELYNEVLKRVKEEEVKFESMQNVISGLIGNTEGDVSELPMVDGSMFVLTNENMLFGSSMILTEVARRRILEKIPNGKVTVLPSSVHELILIPTNADENVEELKDMVRQINKTEVSKEEFLSDNVYHYDANTSKIELAFCE